MNVSRRVLPGAIVVDVDGDVDMEESPVLRKALFEALKEGPKVALNLSAIRYIDSSGIAVLLEALKESQRLSRKFVLFALSKAVYDVFKLTHVIKIFQVTENEAQALGA